MCRVALCVFIACVFGYGVVLPWGGTTPGANIIQYAQACKWAAITSVVIAQVHKLLVAVFHAMCAAMCHNKCID